MFNYYLGDTGGYPGIIAMAMGDVNGDGVPDTVYLTGRKMSDSPFIQNIVLIVQDGQTGMFYHAAFSQNSGYNPNLFLADFTGDGVYDILIRFDSGGSGAFTYDYIYSFLGRTPRILFDFDAYNSAFEYSVNYGRLQG